MIPSPPVPPDTPRFPRSAKNGTQLRISGPRGSPLREDLPRPLAHPRGIPTAITPPTRILRITLTRSAAIPICVPGISLYRANWAEPNTFLILFIHLHLMLYLLLFLSSRGVPAPNRWSLSGPGCATQTIEDEKTR
jgi:hypothetical protein